MPRYTLSDPSLVAFGCESGNFTRDEDGTFDIPEGSSALHALADINVQATLVAEPEPAWPATDPEKPRRGRPPKAGVVVSAIGDPAL